MTKFRCTICQSQYHEVAAALRGYQCHGSPLSRRNGPAAGPNGRGSIPAAPDPSELRVLSITLPRENERDHKVVTNLLSSLMTGQPFSLEMLGDGSGRQLLARASPATLKHIRQQLLGAYTDVECRVLAPEEDPSRPVPTPDPRGEDWPPRPPAVAAGRLRLRRPAYFPLNTFSEADFAEGDPVSTLLGALRVEAGELAHTQLVLAPAPRNWADRWQIYSYTASPQVRGQASPPNTGAALALMGQVLAVILALFMPLTFFISAIAHPSALRPWSLPLGGMESLPWGGMLRFALGTALFWAGGGGGIVYLQRLKRNLLSAAPGNPEVIRDKVSRPAYYVDIRLRACGPTPQKAQAILERLAGAFAVFNRSEGNDLVLIPEAPRPAGDLTAEGQYRVLGEKEAMLLNLAEVAAMWHIPVGGLPEQAEGKLFRTVLARPDWFVPGSTLLGHSVRGAQRIPFGLSPAMLQKNIMLFGKTQTGKSNMQAILANAALQDPETALVVVDPHQDMVNWVLSLVPPERIDDVIYIDASNETLSVGLNLFDLGLGIPGHKLVDDFVNMGRSIWQDNWGPRMESALRLAGGLIMAVNAKVPRDEQMTILDIPHLFTYPKIRRGLIATYVSDSNLASHWLDEWESETRSRQAEISSPVRTKIHRFESSPSTRYMVAQPACTVDLRQALHERKIILVNTAVGTVGQDTGGFIGAIVLNYINSAIREAAALPRDQRPKLMAIIDEFQSVPGVDYGALLGELQKTGAGFVLGTQSISQMRDAPAGTPGGLNRSMVGMLFSNIHTLVSFQVSGEDGRYLQDEFDGVLEVADLTNLKNHTAYVKTSLRGKRLPVVTVETIRAPDGSPEVARAIRRRVARYGRPAEQVHRQHEALMEARFALAPESKLSAIQAEITGAAGAVVEAHLAEVEELRERSGPTTGAGIGSIFG